MTSAPPTTPPDARLASASDATLTPTGPLNVTAPRIVDRRRQRGRGGRLARRVLEADAVFDEDVLGVGEDVHQVRDRRALVAGDVRDARLEQRLGDGEDALAMEDLAGAQAELLDLFDERPLSHARTGPERRWRATWPMLV